MSGGYCRIELNKRLKVTLILSAKTANGVLVGGYQPSCYSRSYSYCGAGKSSFSFCNVNFKLLRHLYDIGKPRLETQKIFQN